MLNQIDEKLTQARARLRRKQKLELMLGEARRILLDGQTKVAYCRKKLGDEQADVEKLEGFSLTGLFCSLLGTKDERLEQERQELLAAKLKHDEAVDSVSHAQGEFERLRADLATFHGVAQEYDRLLAEKEQLVRQAGDGRIETLLNLSEQAGDLQAERTELEEAVEAGETALSALECVREELNSARNWGTWDLLGGGLIATAAKHSRIDSARSAAHRAQQLLHRFNEELADANQRLHLSLDDIGGFSTFADYFFDGLIADWVVQSRIANAASACATTIQHVFGAIAACRARLQEVEQQIRQVGESRRQFIEQA